MGFVWGFSLRGFMQIHIKMVLFFWGVLFYLDSHEMHFVSRVFVRLWTHRQTVFVSGVFVNMNSQMDRFCFRGFAFIWIHRWVLSGAFCLYVNLQMGFVSRFFVIWIRRCCCCCFRLSGRKGSGHVHDTSGAGGDSMHREDSTSNFAGGWVGVCVGDMAIIGCNWHWGEIPSFTISFLGSTALSITLWKLVIDLVHPADSRDWTGPLLAKDASPDVVATSPWQIFGCKNGKILNPFVI